MKKCLQDSQYYICHDHYCLSDMDAIFSHFLPMGTVNIAPLAFNIAGQGSGSHPHPINDLPFLKKSFFVVLKLID